MTKKSKSSNKKIVWAVLCMVAAIILAYAFTVIYFFFISPNNIALRVSIFPVLSDSAIGEQYTDAIVELNFTAKAENELSDEEDMVVFGVNVREDGYVLASFYEFDYFEVGEITAFSNQGGVYSAEIIFSDETLNISILKLSTGSSKGVSLPYVGLYTSEISSDVNIVSVEVGYESTKGTEVKFTNVESGTTYGTFGSVTLSFDSDDMNLTTFAYYEEDVFLFDADGYATTDSGAFIFDRYGKLMGIYGFGSSSGIGFATTVSHISDIFSKVVENYEENQTAYTNGVVSALVGLSAEELYYHSEEKQTNGDGNTVFSFRTGSGNWTDLVFTDNIKVLLSTEFQDISNLNFKWFYLVSDFSYGTATITADSILTEIEINGTKTTITTELQLELLLYGLQSGDLVTIYYYKDYDTQAESGTPELSCATFTF